MPKRSSEEAISSFVEHFASTLVDAGMPRLAARVFAALFVSETGRLTASELADRLHASAGGVSGAVRYLLQVKLIRREREPGTRRDVYVVDSAWYESTVGESPFLARGRAVLREGIEILDGSPPGRRLQETLDFFQFLDEETHAMIERWRERQAQRKAAQG